MFFDINQPSLSIPIYSVLVSIYVFMAISAVLDSITSHDNSPLPQSVFPVLFLSALLVLSTIYLITIIIMEISGAPSRVSRRRLQKALRTNGGGGGTTYEAITNLHTYTINYRHTTQTFRSFTTTNLLYEGLSLSPDIILCG